MPVRLGDLDEVKKGREEDLRAEDHPHGTKFSVTSVDDFKVPEGSKWERAFFTTVEFGQITTMGSKTKKDLRNLLEAKKTGRPEAQFGPDNPAVVYSMHEKLAGLKEDGTQKYSCKFVDDPPGPRGF